MFSYLEQQPIANVNPIRFNELTQSFFPTSSPNEESSKKFWMTVKEKQVDVIVNLTSLEDKGAFPGEEEEEDWPSGVKEVGNGLKVEMLNKEKDRLILKRYSIFSDFHKLFQ